MGDIIKFGSKRDKKTPVEPKKFRYTVCWRNVAYIERLPDNGCRIHFIGGNSISIDRSYDECDKIAKGEWGKDK